MKKNSRHLTAIAALGVAGALLASCAASDSEPNAAEEFSINWALSSSPRALFFPHATQQPTAEVLSLVHEKLLTYDHEGVLAPGLATEWEAVDDLTYVFTLRTDAVFSSGAPVTADDVAYSLGQHLDPEVASQSANHFANIESVEATGDNEVTIRLIEPDATVPYLTAGSVGYIIERASFEEDPDAYGTPAALPVGSGPYMIRAFTPDSSVTLVRNPEYTGEVTGPDQIDFQILADAQARMLAMRTGDIDGTFGVPLANIEEWAALPDTTLDNVTSFGFKSITVDMEQAPFDDIHVRRAIAHSIDREGLVSALLRGYGTPASTYVPPEMFTGLVPEEEIEEFYAGLPEYEYDLEAAKKELAESSVPDGFSATMPVPADSDELIAIAQVIAEDLGKIGIDLELEQMEGGPRIEQLLAHGPDLGFQMMSFGAELPDPAAFPVAFMHSDAAVEGGANSSNYKNPEFDALIDEAVADPDPSHRAGLIMDALEMAAEDVAVMPIYWQDTVVATKDDVMNFDVFGWFTVFTNWASEITAPQN